MKNFKNLSGFPESINYSQFERTENICKNWAKKFGADPILLPMIEKRNLFERSVGDNTDIVEKEMLGINKEEVLRPEGTVVAMRMWNNNGGLRNIKPKKWYYSDFMFRNETPQAGRYKQFKQFGMECIGFKEGIIDIDLIVSLNDLFETLQIKDKITLKINTIGNFSERQEYIKKLKEWLKSNKNELDSLSLERMESNPLRVFDSKVEKTMNLLKEAPVLYDFLSEETKDNFIVLKENLSLLNVDFVVDDKLVRGLDYYNGFVFEFVITENNELYNKTIAAGGRYDSLSKSISGESVEAIGFAIGLERINFIVQEKEKEKEREGYYICWLNNVPMSYVLKVAREFRLKERVEIDPGKRKIVKQLNKADEDLFEFCVIIGPQEVSNNEIKIKDLKNGNEIVQKIT